jgi:parvulin-like peptidyl-prolyl isomerase
MQPSNEEWFTPLRRERLRNEIGAILFTLIAGGIERYALEAWVKKEVAQEVRWDPEKERRLVKRLLKKLSIEQEEFEQEANHPAMVMKLLIPEAVQAWSTRHWSGELESLFLAQKEQLDQVALNLIVVTDSALARELYHRLHAQEDSWEQLARQYSEDQSAMKGGLYPLQYVGDLPYGLNTHIKGLRVGEIAQPGRLGDRTALVCVREFRAARFSQMNRRRLLKNQFKTWLAEAVSYALSILNSDYTEPCAVLTDGGKVTCS